RQRPVVQLGSDMARMDIGDHLSGGVLCREMAADQFVEADTFRAGELAHAVRQCRHRGAARAGTADDEVLHDRCSLRVGSDAVGGVWPSLSSVSSVVQSTFAMRRKLTSAAKKPFPSGSFGPAMASRTPATSNPCARRERRWTSMGNVAMTP